MLSMKKITYRNVLAIVFAVFAVMLAIIGLALYLNLPLLYILGMALFIAGAIMHIHYWRCPSCNAFLGRRVTIPEYCAECGKKL
jgi:membrane protease YdiL (CAAX protease family)